MRERIGRYAILREIGHGAMGRVWLAHDEVVERHVAVKELILPEGTSEEKRQEAVERFKREARAAGRLSHPNIVTVFGVEEDDGVPFIIMEYLEGKSLGQALAEGRMLPSRALEIAIQVGEALAYAHSHQVVHRDIKPDNIFLTSDGRVKVTDFGIARIGESSSMTATGTLVGTPGYMSPEQVRGEKVDARSDIFSLGVVLYEMLTGTNPFAADSFATTLYRIISLELPPLAAFDLTLASQLQAVIDRSTAKSRKLRYAHVGEMCEDLRRCTSGERVIEPPTLLPASQPTRRLAERTLIPGEEAGTLRRTLPSLVGLEAGEAARLRRAHARRAALETYAPSRERQGKGWKLVAVSLVISLACAAGAFLLVRSARSGHAPSASGSQPSGGASSGFDAPYEADPGFLFYEDSQGRFRMEYPQGWSMERRRQDVAAEFYAPLESPYDAYQENVCVMVLDTSSQPRELEGYASKVMSEIQQSLEGVSVEEVGDVSLEGIPGKRLVYSGSLGGVSYRWLQALALSGDRAYVITYTASPDSWGRYLDQVNLMIVRFQVVR